MKKNDCKIEEFQIYDIKDDDDEILINMRQHLKKKREEFHLFICIE